MAITWANNYNGVSCRYEETSEEAQASYALDYALYRHRSVLPFSDPVFVSTMLEFQFDGGWETAR